MRLSHRFGFALALTAGFATTAIAQATATPARPVELGLDAGVSFTLDDPKASMIQIPVQSVRAGFFFTDNVSVEPALSLNSVHVNGGGTVTSYTAEVGLLWHFARLAQTHRVYLRPFAGVTGTSISGEGSNTQTALGAGLGIKCPIANRLATRVEANYAHYLKSGDTDAVNLIGLRFGLSFFTR